MSNTTIKIKEIAGNGIVVFDKPVVVNGAEIWQYQMPASRIPLNTLGKVCQYAVENIFRERGFFRARFDGVNAKIEDQNLPEFKAFEFANACIPEYDVFPTEDEILENAKVKCGEIDMTVGPLLWQLIDADCGKLRTAIRKTRELEKKFFADLAAKDKAETDKAKKEDDELKTARRSVVEALKGVKPTEQKAKEQKANTTKLEPAPQPPVQQQITQQPQPETQVRRTGAPWTRVMTPVDSNGKPAPEPNAPQAHQPVGINVIPNPKPVEKPKQESYDVVYEDQDLTGFEKDPVIAKILEQIKGRVLTNVIPTRNPKIYLFLNFGTGTKKYQPEKSFVLDEGQIFDSSTKIFPIGGNKNVEDRPFAVLKLDDLSNLEKLVKNGKFPVKTDKDETALREKFAKANHLVELTTAPANVALTTFVDAILEREAELKNLLVRFNGRFKVVTCTSDCSLMVLQMDGTCTESALSNPCGIKETYQAVVQKGQPLVFNAVVAAA